MKYRPLLLLLALATTFCSGGANCMQRLRPEPVMNAPIAFSTLPSREQVIEHVNANSARVRQLQSTAATIGVPGLPSLRASIAYERPQRFRLLADHSFTGSELDLGSNDEIFWMWVKRNQPPAVLFARHQEFQQSAARAVLPVEPGWLVQALGLVEFDPLAVHEGPTQPQEGQLQIRSVIPSADGQRVKITVLDAAYGHVIEQHLYDERGERLASALASKHHHDSATGVTLPRHVEIQLPASHMNFQVDVQEYLINRLAGDPSQLWSMPNHEGYPPMNLANLRPPGGGPPASAYPPVNAGGFLPPPVNQAPPQHTEVYPSDRTAAAYNAASYERPASAPPRSYYDTAPGGGYAPRRYRDFAPTP